MIEPLTSLAFSLYSNKGVYALLLGSGVSRSAGIPTGWQIVLDLIRQIAHLQNEDCEPDPAAWYQTTFGQEPDYADLLDKVARTPTERNQLLRHYFEPSEEDREQGLKVPTAAHHAIARLVANGFVRVILTTNFDRLMEQALEAIGIVPTVISTPDAIEGALPLVHTRCTVIKIHGDYLDTRIKNTPTELSAYDDRSNRLLDRVFDEYGLVICGWSAEWDHALLAAMERCPNRRFTTYWAVVGTLGEAAQRMVAHRQAIVIPIEGADPFFASITEKVVSMEELAQPHPLSPAIAAATLKRYLGAGQTIKLYDLVMGETDAIKKHLAEPQFDLNEPFSVEALRLRLRQYEEITQTLLSIMIQGCYWGEREQDTLWVKSLERVHGPHLMNGDQRWQKLRALPALLLFYAGGISAIAAGKYHTLTALFKQGKVASFNRQHPTSSYLYPASVLDKEQVMTPLMDHNERGVAYLLGSNWSTPGCDFVYGVLKEPCRNLFSTEFDYSETFNRFEYLLALFHTEQRIHKNDNPWAPAGRFLWSRNSRPEDDIKNQVQVEVMDQRGEWEPFRTGLFVERTGNVVQDFLDVKKQLDDLMFKSGQ